MNCKNFNTKQNNKISEREAFVRNIPIIAEMTVDSKKLTENQYQQWKQESLDEAPEDIKGFTKKVLHVIDTYR